MNDFKPFKHGEEGTHGCCNKRMKKEGLQSHCCYCVPHEGCEYVLPSVAKDSHSTPTPVKKYCTHKNPTMQALYPSLVPVCITCKLPSTPTPEEGWKEELGIRAEVIYHLVTSSGLSRDEGIKIIKMNLGRSILSKPPTNQLLKPTKLVENKATHTPTKRGEE